MTSAGALLLVAARTTPGWRVVYLADPAGQLPLAERLQLRWPVDGHNPTIVAATTAQLLRVLWAAATRMAWRYLVTVLRILTVSAIRNVAPAAARWLATLAPHQGVLVVVSKQLLPPTSPERPLAARFRLPLVALADHGRAVAIHLLLTVATGVPDEPINLGRAGTDLEEIPLEAAAAAAGSLPDGQTRPGRR
jgi:hypothetical protein